jgi:hypothetical protein
MIRSRFASILLLASATSFAGWKVAYHPGNVATDRPPSAWDMAGNLWIWPTVSGTLQQVAPGKDSSSTANPSTGFVLPVNFAATGSGRLVTAFSYTALATSVDSGKRWDTLATVTRNYGIAAGRGIWIAPSLADYRGKSTGVVLSGTWDSKKVDTLVSSMAVGLNLGILPGDIPLVVRTWSTNLGVRYMSFHALKSPATPRREPSWIPSRRPARRGVWLATPPVACSPPTIRSGSCVRLPSRSRAFRPP